MNKCSLSDYTTDTRNLVKQLFVFSLCGQNLIDTTLYVVYNEVSANNCLLVMLCHMRRFDYGSAEIRCV
jgi:hypothetical protein